MQSTTVERQAEALSRARDGLSATNYGAIIHGFVDKGIAAEHIEPRVNVFTFAAWKALGRSVRKGEHGVKVLTFIRCDGKVNAETGTLEPGYSRPWSTTVFHVSQTDEIGGAA